MKYIDTRRSVREYSDQVVSDKDIKKILAAAMQAPSARNQQPCEFLVVKDKKKKAELADTIPSMRMASGAEFLIIFLSNKEKLTSTLYYQQDMAAATTLAMVEARSLGIGSVWCGGAPNDDRVNIIKKIFDIKDENIEPFSVVCFGYPKDDSVFKKVKRYDKKRVHYEVM